MACKWCFPFTEPRDGWKTIPAPQVCSEQSSGEAPVFLCCISLTACAGSRSWESCAQTGDSQQQPPQTPAMHHMEMKCTFNWCWALWNNLSSPNLTTFYFFFKQQGWCITTPRCLLLTATQINPFGCAKMSIVWNMTVLGHCSIFSFSGEKLVKDKEHVAHVPACTNMHSHLPHVSLLGTACQENSCRYIDIEIDR